MNTPSAEQQVIINHIQQGKNVIVDACAGSGKSTTILSCALVLRDKKVLQLTYNKTLRHEVQEKIVEIQIPNMEVHTYHSLAYNYYHHDGQMDNGIRRIIRDNIKPKTKLPEFDLLVVDEAQDMTVVYYRLLLKFIHDSQRPFQVLILGDKMQGLYDFKGADTRFLTFGQSCWQDVPLLVSNEFVCCTLKTSYRITVPMARFVNNALLDEKRLWAVKQGSPVMYARRDNFATAKCIVAQIAYLIDQGAVYEDFYILAGSIKGKFIKILENMLVERNIPCYLPSQENQDQLDKRIIHQKVVFSTFHSVKGRQRKYVFVLGFDDSYFKYYARNLPIDICPNTMYVACTRGLERLYVFEKSGHEQDAPLPFLKMSHSMMMKSEVDYINFQGTSMGLKVVPKENDPSKKKYRYNVFVTDLIKFLSEPTLDTISPIVDKLFVKIDTTTMDPYEDQETEYIFEQIEIQGVKQTRTEHYEDVSDINGIVLPMLFYDHLQDGQQKCILQNLVRLAMTDVPKDKHTFLHKMIETMPEQCDNISDYLFVANLCSSVQEKLYSKLKQINRDEYDWLDQDVVDVCLRQLERVVGPECRSQTWTAEKSIIMQSSDIDHYYIDRFVSELLNDEGIVYRIGARVDLMTETSIWEMKCTSNLTIDHKLQLILYMWIWNMTVHPSEWPKHSKTGYLFNIKNGELLRLETCMEDMNKIVSEILKDKYKKTIPKTDDEFLDMIRDIKFDK